MGDNARSDEAKLNCKDLYNELLENRKIEINKLWQRSAFLIGLLLVAFTGYGALWNVVLSNENLKFFETINFIGSIKRGLFIETAKPLQSIEIVNSINILRSIGNPNLGMYKFINIGFLGIAGCGICFSIFWIMMTKGSKYWVEKFEASIKRALEYEDFLAEDVKAKNKGGNNNPESMEIKKGFPRYGYLENILKYEDKYNLNIFKADGGPYSVSRVNIGIGIFTLVVWIALFACHFIFGILILCPSFIEKFWLLLICIVPTSIIFFLFFFRTPFYSGESLEKLRKRFKKEFYNACKYPDFFECFKKDYEIFRQHSSISKEESLSKLSDEKVSEILEDDLEKLKYEEVLRLFELLEKAEEKERS